MFRRIVSEGEFEIVIGETQIIYGLIASLIAAGVSTIGLLSMVALGDWGRRNSSYFSAFAIGVLLVAVFFHLAPEALSYDLNSWVWMVFGFMGMTIFGLALRLMMGRRNEAGNLAFGYASIIALGFHSFLDGIVYETTFQEELFTGWIATAGLLLHEFPEGVIAYFLMIEAGARRLTAAFWAFFAASVTTVAGALSAGLLIGTTNALTFGPLLGVTAGGLIYIMVFHLGPHARFTPHMRGYLLAMIGVSIAIAALILRHLAEH